VREARIRGTEAKSSGFVCLGVSLFLPVPSRLMARTGPDRAGLCSAWSDTPEAWLAVSQRDRESTGVLRADTALLHCGMGVLSAEGISILRLSTSAAEGAVDGNSTEECEVDCWLCGRSSGLQSAVGGSGPVVACETTLLLRDEARDRDVRDNCF
jgi:hypothetical protein